MVVVQKTDILSKLKKLQALADRAGTPEEAAVAATKVQELLFKHNLEMSDIQLGDDESSVKREYIKGTHQIKYAASWCRSLIWDIAKSNFCDTVYTRGTTRVSIVGESHNVEAVKMLYDYVQAQIIQLRNEAWKTEGRFTSSRESAWKTSFDAGCAARIGTRLQQERRRLQEETEQSNALVLVTDQELKDAMTRYYPNLGRGTAGRNLTGSGYGAGLRAGDRVALNKSLPR